MSDLVLSSFFDFLRLFFAFAMPLSCLSVFFRPWAAARLAARLSPLKQSLRQRRFPFNCGRYQSKVSLTGSSHVEEINMAGKKSTHARRCRPRAGKRSACSAHCLAEAILKFIRRGFQIRNPL